MVRTLLLYSPESHTGFTIDSRTTGTTTFDYYSTFLGQGIRRTGNDTFESQSDGTNSGLSAIGMERTNIKFYANKVATTATPGDMALVHTYTTAAGIPDDSNMRLCLLVETGTGAVSTARIEYIKGAYTK